MLLMFTLNPFFIVNYHNITGQKCGDKDEHSQSCPLYLSVCVSLCHRHRAQLQLEAETPGKRYPSVCRSVSVTQYCCVSSKWTPLLHITTNPCYWQHTREWHWSLNDRSISLSLSLSESMPILSTSHFILLPSNQWSRASKQKSNRLHSWLFMSFGNLSHQVRGFGSCTESALLTLAEHFTLTWCCSAFRAWRTVGWTPFTTSVKSLFIYSIWIDTSCFSVHVHTDKQP